MPATQTNTTEEKLRMLDEIVGRCVRDSGYAARVLENPDVTLAPCGDDDVIGDFRALAKDRENTLTQWAAIRDILTPQTTQ